MRSLGILWSCYEKSGNIVVLIWKSENTVVLIQEVRQ